jgi:hypothetical protein
MNPMLFKVTVLCLPMLTLIVPPASAQPTRLQKPPVTELQVYKTPTCGCCGNWVDHVRAAGFTPAVHDMADLSGVKAKAGVPADLQSCHTAFVGGYVIEGHVPADVIRRLLQEKPDIAGIAVPGMPIGSPGMEQGSRKDAYEVIAFTKDGKTSVYAKRP